MPLRETVDLLDDISSALKYAFQYGQIDGNYHKLWVIDQMVRALLGGKLMPNGEMTETKEYRDWVRNYEGKDQEYNWETGIAP